jgi:hypothetical protein
MSFRDDEGEKKFVHCRCPGLKERAAMRREALVQSA